MAERLLTLDVRTREHWRHWLAKHHGSSPGIWLVRHKRYTGIDVMSYEDLVSEALCFGWVDSLIKRLDGDRYAIKVTPRKSTSNRTNAKAWQFFQRLTPTYRRDFVVWIHTAKRPETREKRIRESIALLAAGKKLGLK
jgi:uncharacterized protein YdeI (YjbR/CyaY-like superfamily)